jgi:periplasmic protein TonB
MNEIVDIRIHEEEKNEKQRKLIGALGTFLILLGLLALLVFFGFQYMDPPPPEQGVIVSMGEPDAGNSDDSPRETTEEQATPTPTEEESNETQDFEDAPEEAAKEPQKQTPVPVPPTPVKPKEDPKPKVDPSTLFHKGPKGDGTGKGDKGKPGDEGDPNGQLGGTPGGMGNGPGGTPFYMNSRKIETDIVPSCKFTRNETVIVVIKVDKQGNVKDADCRLKYKIYNSTTISEPYCSCAVKDAKRIKFNPKPDAPDTQEGAVQFDFKVQ